MAACHTSADRPAGSPRSGRPPGTMGGSSRRRLRRWPPSGLCSPANTTGCSASPGWATFKKPSRCCLRLPCRSPQCPTSRRWRQRRCRARRPSPRLRSMSTWCLDCWAWREVMPGPRATTYRSSARPPACSSRRRSVASPRNSACPVCSACSAEQSGPRLEPGRPLRRPLGWRGSSWPAAASSSGPS